jgi:type III secretion protein Q
LIELPSSSAIAARALRDLAPRLPAKLSIAGTDVVASLVTGERPASPDDWHRLGARVASHAAVVALAPELLPQAAIAHWPEIERVGVPDALGAILRDLLLEEIGRDIERLTGEAPRWSAATLGDPLPYAVSLARTGSTAPIATIEFDERTLSWLATRCAVLPSHQVSIDALKLSVGLVIDRMMVSRAELARIAPRDVILLDQSPLDSEGAVVAVLCMPGFPGFRVRITGSRASLESPVDAAMDTPASPPTASIDEVPLAIECDVGRISLTIAQLRELAVGQVLDLGFDATSRVALRLNGQVIATGELVRIAERTGVRITDVLLSRTA